jgi:hypothetical protein
MALCWLSTGTNLLLPCHVFQEEALHCLRAILITNQ